MLANSCSPFHSVCDTRLASIWQVGTEQPSSVLMKMHQKPRPGISIQWDQPCSGIPVPLLLRFRQSPVIHGSGIHVPPVVLRNLRGGIQA